MKAILKVFPLDTYAQLICIMGMWKATQLPHRFGETFM